MDDKLIESGGIVREEVRQNDRPFLGFDPAALSRYETVSRMYKNLLKSLEKEIRDNQGLCSKAASLASLEIEHDDGIEKGQGAVISNLVLNDEAILTSEHEKGQRAVISTLVLKGHAILTIDKELGIEMGEGAVISSNLALNDQAILISDKKKGIEMGEGAVISSNLVLNDKAILTSSDKQEGIKKGQGVVISNLEVYDQAILTSDKEEGIEMEEGSVVSSNLVLYDQANLNSDKGDAIEMGEGAVNSSNLVLNDLEESPRSQSDVAWAFGSLIWEIFNPLESVASAAGNPLKNIPVNLLRFYKKCLNKNPLKRPSSKMIQDFLISSQCDKKIVKDFKVPDNGEMGRSDLVEEMTCASESLVERDVEDRQVNSRLSEVDGGDEIEVSEEFRVEVGSSETIFDGDEGVNIEKEKKNVCSLCFRKYIHKTHLRRHMIACHKNQLDVFLPNTKKLYQCKLCDKSYTKRHHLKRHVNQKHSSSGQNSLSKRLLSQVKPIPLSPYEKLREDRIREKRLFLEALNRET